MTIGIRNEWPWLFKRTNATTFTFWLFEIERDRMLGTVEIEFIIFGLGLCICSDYRFNDSPFGKALKGVKKEQP